MADAAGVAYGAWEKDEGFLDSDKRIFSLTAAPAALITATSGLGPG
jgi:hypothetical protein